MSAAGDGARVGCKIDEQHLHRTADAMGEEGAQAGLDAAPFRAHHDDDRKRQRAVVGSGAAGARRGREFRWAGGVAVARRLVPPYATVTCEQR